MLNLKEDPKLHFYCIFSKRKWTRHFIPLKAFLWWNALSYKHDEKFHKIEEKIQSFTDKWGYPVRKLRWWYQDNILGFRGRVKQSWDFAKLGWYDADWDYAYFLGMIKFKLDRMEKLVRKNNRHLGCKKTCDQMRIVSNCLDFVLKDKTSNMLFEELNEKFPERKDREDLITSLSRNRVVEIDEHGKKCVYFVSSAYKSKHEEEYREELKKLSYYYDELKTAHLRVAFHIMLPALLSKKEYDMIHKRNREIYEEYGYDNDETLKLIKEIHSGVYNWWD